MEKTPNPKSVGFAPIWLKLVSSAWDLLDLTIPWNNEVIYAEHGVHYYMQPWEFHSLSLSSTRVGPSGWVLVDVSVNRLRRQFDYLSDW